MINVTNIKHPTTVNQIEQAMRDCLADHRQFGFAGSAGVFNKDNELYMLVEYIPATGRNLSGTGLTGFRFTDCTIKGQWPDCTTAVRNVLACADHIRVG